MKFHLSLFLFLVAFPIVAQTATAADPAPLTQPGVVFTFDDRFVDQWVAAMPLFAEYDAKATFFVSEFDRLSPKQIEGLKKLQAAGHAVGCHSMRHLKAVDFVKKHSLEEYLDKEIRPAVRLMRNAGFEPTGFAYPCSQNNAETDTALLKIFRHLRTGTGQPKGTRLAELNAIFVKLADVPARGCLRGRGIDYAGVEGKNRPLDEIFEALDRAGREGEIVVFYAHNISKDGPGHHIRPEKLEAVLRHGKQIGLRFYTFDELP